MEGARCLAALLCLVVCATVAVTRADEANVCHLPKDPGLRVFFRYLPRYYYDSARKKCLRFLYYGLGGNRNRFDSERACKMACVDVCGQPRDPGPCNNKLPRYHYDSEAGECKRFHYGGCLGNENNFPDLRACSQKCVCHQARQEDDCQQRWKRRWYYNRRTGRCQRFTGCEGKVNNFRNMGECWRACVQGKKLREYFSR